MKDMTILCNNLCHHSKTKVYAWVQVSTQSEVVIGIWCGFVLKYNSFKLFKLTELAYVGHLPRHDSFSDFPIQFVNAMNSIEPYVGLMLAPQHHQFSSVPAPVDAGNAA